MRRRDSARRCVSRQRSAGLKRHGAWLAGALAAVAIALAVPAPGWGSRNIPFTADEFLRRAGAGEAEIVVSFLAAGMPVDARECCDPRLQVGGPATGDHRPGGGPAKEYRTALIAAAEHGHDTVVEVLLERGADVEAGNHAGETALTLAAAAGHVEVVRVLLEHGADISSSTALLAAVRGGWVGIARMLLEHGARVNSTDSSGRGALHWAAASGDLAVTRLLLREGAELNAVSVDAPVQTPLDLARDADIVQLLRGAGAKLARELR